MEVDAATPHPGPPQPTSPALATARAPTRIALPLSDTPVINRNKEMRKKAAASAASTGGGGGRRSSPGVRGRRASSLIESGHSAVPHREVGSAEFYKHIASDGGLPEPRRMRALLSWCGERALSEKPPLGSPNPHMILGALAIERQLLKDFGAKPELSDWFSRDESEAAAPAVPKKEVIMKPNPKNMEHEQRIADLEERIRRLREEKSAWLALRKQSLEQQPLFSPLTDGHSSLSAIPLPDASTLDEEDAATVRFLTDPDSSSCALAAGATERLGSVASAIGFRVDQLADGVHKLEMRVGAGGREADVVLGMCAATLRRREEWERTRTRTRDLPVVEVLRSLGQILSPDAAGEGDGG